VVRFAPIAEYALGPLTTSSPLSARWLPCSDSLESAISGWPRESMAATLAMSSPPGTCVV